jgi:hypothetical protein
LNTTVSRLGQNHLRAQVICGSVIRGGVLSAIWSVTAAAVTRFKNGAYSARVTNARFYDTAPPGQKDFTSIPTKKTSLT